MKKFQQYTMDFSRCREQIKELEELLKKDELSEGNELSPFFKRSRDLVCLIGHLHPSVINADQYAEEFDVFGDFKSDFAIGQHGNSAYCFIELEDARENSIFTDTGKSSRDWGRRFEHGYSQIIDWSYKLEELEKTDVFEDRFGARSIDSFSVLLIGRNQHLTDQEKRRLKWRERNVTVRSQQVKCLTYDDVLLSLKQLAGTVPNAYSMECQLIDLDDVPDE